VREILFFVSKTQAILFPKIVILFLLNENFIKNVTNFAYLIFFALH
jgi:hypothetical protein